MACRFPPVAFEFLDHTADIGVTVEGLSLSDLFAAAGVVLAELVYDPAEIEEIDERRVRVEADSREELLVRWLNELLYLFEVEQLLWRTVEVEIRSGTVLSATLRGETFRADKHTIRTGLKAATYHQLEIVSRPGSHRARIIFDV